MNTVTFNPPEGEFPDCIKFEGGIAPERGDIVSEGTCNPDDLHYAFCRALERYGMKHGRYFDICIDDEQRDSDIYMMYDIFDHIAPENCYFGAHSGDGALFGFWPVEDHTRD